MNPGGVTVWVLLIIVFRCRVLYYRVLGFIYYYYIVNNMQ